MQHSFVQTLRKGIFIWLGTSAFGPLGAQQMRPTVGSSFVSGQVGAYNLMQVVGQPFAAFQASAQTASFLSQGQLLPLLQSGVSAGLHLQLYPNPTHSHAVAVFQAMGSEPVSTRVAVRDVRGALVYERSESVLGSRLEVPMADLPEGIYAVSVQVGLLSATQKIIKLNP